LPNAGFGNAFTIGSSKTFARNILSNFLLHLKYIVGRVSNPQHLSYFDVVTAVCQLLLNGYATYECDARPVVGFN